LQPEKLQKNQQKNIAKSEKQTGDNKNEK